MSDGIRGVEIEEFGMDCKRERVSVGIESREKVCAFLPANSNLLGEACVIWGHLFPNAKMIWK